MGHCVWAEWKGFMQAVQCLPLQVCPALPAQPTAQTRPTHLPCAGRTPAYQPTLQEEFLENLGKAAEALQHVVPQVVAFIAGRRLSEL